jgi:predicted acetyltransferase
MTGVSLREALAAEKVAFRRMLDAYLVEHSAKVDPEGRYDPLDFPTFDLYWTEPRRRPFWIIAGEHPAGLALVGGFSPSRRGVDFGLIEFYVAPEHRRQGVGMAAAAALFSGMPGLWELQAHHRTPDAMAFWERAIAAVRPESWERIDGADTIIHRLVSRPQGR